MLIALLALLVPGLAQQAEPLLSVPDYFADGMVLQRGQPIRIWGKAQPGHRVHVIFDFEHGSTEKEVRHVDADAQGDWIVEFSARAATTLPSRFDLTSGSQHLQIKDVLIGDVWFAAGQSNMEWPLSRSRSWPDLQRQLDQGPDFAKSVSTLRFYQAEFAATGAGGAWSQQTLQSMQPDRFRRGTWSRSHDAALATFSAVAWHFGHSLQQQLQIPIGLIDVAAGGTPTEAWISQQALADDPKLASLVRPGNWLDHEKLGAWCRQRARENLSTALREGWTIPGDSTGPHHAFQPGFMWTTAVAPFTRMPICGVIWYQGESNADSAERVQQHDALFRRLLASWRGAWERPDLPFYFVQLPAMNREHWPAFREQQRQLALSLPHTAMAVTIDLGDPHDVHPRNKKPVGERLAQLAHDPVRRTSDHLPRPGIRTASVCPKGVELKFWDVGQGIGPVSPNVSTGLEWQDRAGQWHPVRSLIQSGPIKPHFERYAISLIAECPPDEVKAVRYAWAPVPVVTLFGSDGQPIGPFVITINRD